MKKITFLYLLLLVPILGWGQSKLSPYTVQFLNSIKKADVTGDSVALKQYQLYHSPGNETYISAFIYLNHIGDLSLLEEKGIRVGTMTNNIITARIPINKIQEIADMNMVKYIEMGTPVYTNMDEAKIGVQADKVQQGIELPHEFRGKDIVIGVIDDGFDYGHPNFWNSEKTEFRIKRVWNQNKNGESPEAYAYGTEYKTEESILNALTDTEQSTHGTHVLGIAAGADCTDGHSYSGIATEADIVLVSLNTNNMVKGDNTTIIDGINYIFDYAESVGKPCVINLSLGSYLGPRDGSSAFDQMADALQGPGKLIVGAVGNDGMGKVHLSKTFREEQKDTLKTFINFNHIYPKVSFIEIWGEEGMEYAFVPIVYDVQANKVISSCEPATISQAKKEYNFEADKDPVVGTMIVTSEINPNNHKPHMTISANFFNFEEYYIGFYVISKTHGNIHIWVDNIYSSLSNFNVQAFSDGDSDSSMGEIGGTGKQVISVGAYTTRDHYSKYGIYYPSGEELGAIASFSSRGPTPDGRIKPDITAPGTYIISSLSSYYTQSIIKATSVSWNDRTYNFGYMQGTSMASPLVTGILATWLQAYPELTPAKVKEIFKDTSVRDRYTNTIPEKGSNLWGQGKIDAWNGLKECIRQTNILGKPLQDKIPAVVILNESKQCRLLFTQSQTLVSVRLYNLEGSEIYNCGLKSVTPGEEYLLDLSNESAGVYVVKVTGDNSFNSQKIVIR